MGVLRRGRRCQLWIVRMLHRSRRCQRRTYTNDRRWQRRPRARNIRHAKATIVLKAAKSTRSPDFGGDLGLRVAFAAGRLILRLIPLDRAVFCRSKNHLKLKKPHVFRTRRSHRSDCRFVVGARWSAFGARKTAGFFGRETW